MANHISALKRARQNEKRQLRNKAHRTHMRSAVKNVRQALLKGNANEAEVALLQAISIVDKAASRRIIHSNKASRYVSRLSRKIKELKDKNIN